MTRRFFCAGCFHAALFLALPLAQGSAGVVTQRGQLNVLMATLLGLDPAPSLNLAREADTHLGPGWEEIFEPLLNAVSTPDGLLNETLLGQLLNTPEEDASPLSALARLLRSNAIKLYYMTPQGWEDVGYRGLPLKRTTVHDALRRIIFPNCNAPCHALMRLVHGD